MIPWSEQLILDMKKAIANNNYLLLSLRLGPSITSFYYG